MLHFIHHKVIPALIPLLKRTLHTLGVIHFTVTTASAAAVPLLLTSGRPSSSG